MTTTYSLGTALKAARKAISPSVASRRAVNGFRGWGSSPKDVRAESEWNCRCLKSTVKGLLALFFSIVCYAVGSGGPSSLLCTGSFGLMLLHLHRSYFYMAQVKRIEERRERREAARKLQSRY
jgi:hypothetical protein